MLPPSPATITLLIKSHKTTLLLYALPTTTIGDLRASVYRVLHENESNIDVDLPDDEDGLVLGAMIDPMGMDVDRGFHELGLGGTLRDAGVRDGGIVAWKREGSVFWVEVGDDGEREEEEEEGEGGEGEGEGGEDDDDDGGRKRGREVEDEDEDEDEGEEDEGEGEGI